MHVLISNCGGEKANTRQGGRELDSNTLIGTRKHFHITFLVIVDAGENPQDMGEENAMAAAGVPALRSLYNSAYVREKFASEVDDVKGLWEVVCILDSKVDASEPSVFWEWSSEQVERLLTRDPVTLAPFVNSVGEPYFVTAPTCIPILTIKRIESTFSPATILAYVNRCNSATFWGAPIGCALMAGIDDVPVLYAGSYLRQVTYVIKFDLTIDPDTGLITGWGIQLLNHGTKFKIPTIWSLPDGRTINGTDGSMNNFQDLQKNPTTGNLRLNGTACDQIEANGLPLIPPDDPTYLFFNRFPRVNFNTLSLGPY
jgi:hypothetical protein